MNAFTSANIAVSVWNLLCALVIHGMTVAQWFKVPLWAVLTAWLVPAVGIYLFVW